jgi:CHASE1-domain containing sensor protein
MPRRFGAFQWAGLAILGVVVLLSLVLWLVGVFSA